MKNLKVITMAMFALVIFASVSFAAPVKVILGTTNQLAIPFTGKLNPNGKVVLGGIQLTWTQAAKNADVFANLPAGIAEGNYMLEINGKKRMVCVGPFSAEVGLTNLIDDEVLRANTAEAGLTNSINEVSNRTFTAETYFTNNINSTSNSLANLSSNLNFKAFMSYKAVESVVSPTNNFLFPEMSTEDGSTTWTTDSGASFVIPTAGTYQVGFQVDLKSTEPVTSPYEIHVNRNDGSSTYSVYSCYYYEPGSHAGQVILSFNAGDIVTLQNSSEVRNIEIWSSSLYILQIK